MSVISTLFSSATISTLGMALLHSLWQASLIALFTFLILRVCQAPRWRYFWAGSALALCLILPLHFIVTRLLGAVPAAASPLLAGLPITANLVVSAPSASGNQLASLVPMTALPWLVCVWALGVVGMCLRMALGLRWVQGQVRMSVATTAEDLAQQRFWQGKLDALVARAALPKLAVRHVRLGLSAVLESPVTAGCWRPVVILPTALVSGMPVELIEALLAHEVAHVKRMDYLINLLQSAIEIILFYHPAVWWLSKQIRLEREQIADDIAAGLLGEPRRLALALSELERFQFTTPQLAQAAHGGNLMSRIKRLVRPDLSGNAHTISLVQTRGWKALLALCGLATASTMIYVQAQTVAPTTPALKPAAVTSAKNAAEGAQKSALKASATASEKHSTQLHHHSSNSTNINDEQITITENGRRYVIKDPQLLQQAKEAHKAMDELGTQMEEQGKKMDVQGQVMEEIGRKMEAISAPDPHVEAAFEKKLAAYEKKMAAYEKKLESLAKRRENARNPSAEKAMQDVEQQVQTQMRELADVIETLSQSTQVNEQKIRDAYAPLEELGKKMSEASAPMESMSAQMEALSKKMEIASQEMEKKLKQIIANARQAGLLIPVEKS